MRQMSVISGHPIFIGFRRLTGYQRDPRDRGVTCTSLNLYFKMGPQMSENQVK